MLNALVKEQGKFFREGEVKLINPVNSCCRNDDNLTLVAGEDFTGKLAGKVVYVCKTCKQMYFQNFDTVEEGKNVVIEEEISSYIG